ncbi:unnamed protein product [Paramecium sonneborni]|uniref:Uncharacterized protein n=1 Tax=Paramecium sonneborni TaxID=65129 RepID=A0A8S1RM94_9CILI|nr:unnamed protein product [Paramecium sonneborni]
MVNQLQLSQHQNREIRFIIQKWILHKRSKNQQLNFMKYLNPKEQISQYYGTITIHLKKIKHLQSKGLEKGQK